MSNYTGSVPETQRKTDWRTKGACADQDPELFFPTGSEGGWKEVIADAKTICGRCPVKDQCLQYAMDNGIDFGVWGGLSEKERRALRRRKAANITPKEIEDVRRPATLREAWEPHTRAQEGGHLGWFGKPSLYFQGTSYTPKRASFLISRGHKPIGQVQATCGVDACVLPAHLTDAKERYEQAEQPDPQPGLAPCGSRSAYQRHVRNGEAVDEPCRIANLTHGQEYRQAKQVAA